MVKFTSWCFQTSFHSYPHDLKKMASNSIWARKKSFKCSTYCGDFTIIDVTAGVMLLTPVLQLPQKMAGIQCGSGRPNDKPRTLGALACWNA